MKRLAVLISGTGSIMEAIHKSGIEIGAVIADRHCSGLALAKACGIWNRYQILRKNFMHPSGGFNRHAFTGEFKKVLDEEEIDIVMMAGFMTVLNERIFSQYANRIINTHPSLLPSFKGDTAVADALEYGVKVTGCTMHYATSVLDEGPIIDQRAVPVLSGDDIQSLHERIKVEERKMVPENLKRLMAA